MNLELGYSDADLRRLRALGGEQLDSPDDIKTVVDRFGYQADWRSDYHVRSVRCSLHATRITCLDAAVFAYGLVELLFGHVERRLLAIHRRDPATGEECGHCVTLYWNAVGKIGAFGKSSFDGLGHRAPVFATEHDVAESYAKAYLRMGFEPLYFGVAALEQVAPDIDWRFDPDPINALSERIQSTYAYEFACRRGTR
jgi:hypothetical protein